MPLRFSLSSGAEGVVSVDELERDNVTSEEMPWASKEGTSDMVQERASEE
jgi:hypothetical protein